MLYKTILETLSREDTKISIGRIGCFLVIRVTVLDENNFRHSAAESIGDKSMPLDETEAEDYITGMIQRINSTLDKFLEIST